MRRAIKNVFGLQRTSAAFRTKLVDVADRLGIEPSWLAGIISFETAGTFSPAVPNGAGSGAVGLIQFMPETARGLGTSTAALAAMTAFEQLDFVEKHFAPYRGKMTSLSDAYMAVLWPVAVGKGPDAVLFSRPGARYDQNKALDADGDGIITAREATAQVQAVLDRATGDWVIPDPLPPAGEGPASGSAPSPSPCAPTLTDEAPAAPVSPPASTTPAELAQGTAAWTGWPMAAVDAFAAVLVALGAWKGLISATAAAAAIVAIAAGRSAPLVVGGGNSGLLTALAGPIRALFGAGKP